MKTKKTHKWKAYLAWILFLAVLFLLVDHTLYGTLFQTLKITAKTTAEEFDLLESTNVYCLKGLKSGTRYKAIIKFKAVPNTSKSLFTHHGTGEYVFLGCSELKTEYDFISAGRFIKIRLTLNAARTELSLKDGTPFDMTRYSLKPVLEIEELNTNDI